ncbi:hypothetical protein GCM10023116_13430 [Kistimonas scapharcae]|uniref:Uncharacterized protein n=1 Tax=Kistimonas scapharcae TaxID=1036133 RepID=A0ABP8V0F2_9GAMM
MSKAIKPSVYLNNKKMHITECTDGFWLYDEDRGRNLAMGAVSEREAMVEALRYYQQRVTALQTSNKRLRQHLIAIAEIIEQEDLEL